MLNALYVLAGLVAAAAGVVLLVWLLWLLWQRREPEAEIEVQTAEPAAAPEPAQEVAEPAPEPAAPPPADDLKRIEGIGPKISAVLQEAGISTFARLADTEVEQLRDILKASDPRLLRLADPTSWPEQASLAASGEWEALAALQQQLKRSRAK